MQVSLLLFIFGYTIFFLEQKGVSRTNRNLIWIVYALCPYIVGYVGVVLKDVLYSAMFLLFVIFCVHYLEEDDCRLSWKTLVGLTVSGALTILARKNGKEIVYPTLLAISVMTIWRNRRRFDQMLKGVMALLLPVVCAAVITNGLTAYYQIWEASIREALSMPFQQTARTVRDHGEEIPEEERQAIDVILHYDTLAERYKPMLSDPVKNLYNDDATTEELLAYGRVWFRQLTRYPMTYLEATLHQNYQLFCILSDNYYFYYRSAVEYEGTDLIEEYPILEKIESRFISYYKLCCDLPVICLLSRSSFYCILLAVITVFIWCERRYKLLIMVLPMWLTVGICILGPVINGNPRYMLPIVYSLPFVYGYYTIRRNDPTETAPAPPPRPTEYP